jgi:hypothetical protein
MLSGPTKNIAYLLLVFALVVSCFEVAHAQLPSQDPGHKEDAEVSGVKFSVPNSFNLEEFSDSRVAFMRHKKYDLALFVAVPEKQVDDNYLTSLSNTLTSQLFPKEKDFRWKLLPRDSDKKVSKFQVTSGNTKGFNGERLFQTDYIAVKVKDREILVGYITQLGQFSDNAKYLFNLKDVAGMSMPGWYAQAHILASITGERYEEINPGTVIRTTPVKKN